MFSNYLGSARRTFGAALTWCLFIIVPGVGSAQIQFQNTTETALEPIFTETWGVSVGDFNGDNWADVFVGNHRQRPSLYRNNGDGTFTNVVLQADITKSWLSNRFIDHHGAAFADIDGDGDEELLASTNSAYPGYLMINNGGFLNEEAQIWDLDTDGGSWSAAWLDYTDDSWLDVIQISFDDSRILFRDERGVNARDYDPGPSIDCNQNNYAQLIDLDGDGELEVLCVREGTFPQRVYQFDNGQPNEVASLAPSIANTVDTVVADFNNDLRADIFALRGSVLPNEAAATGPNSFEASIDADPNQGEGGLTFRTDGVVTLTVYSRFNPVTYRKGASGVFEQLVPGEPIILDPNDNEFSGVRSNRGGQQLYIGYTESTETWSIIQTGESGSFDGYWYVYLVGESTTAVSDVEGINIRAVDLPNRPRLETSAAGGFTNNTFEAGFSDPLSCSSATTGDYDNDMDTDLYVICRTGVSNISNRLFENQGDGTFVEVAGAGGAGGVIGAGLSSNAGIAESVVSIDYDNDGFLDLFVTNGLNSQPIRVGGPHEIFRNSGNGNNWVKLKLLNGGSRNPAIGARVIASAGGTSQLRELNGGYHRWSQDDKTLHFGLAANNSVDLVITWPDGDVQQINNLDANSFYEIEQGANAITLNPGPVEEYPAPVSGDECVDPTFLADLDRALFISRNCSTGRWTIRVTGGYGNAQYVGALIENGGNVSAVNDFSFEAGDVLNVTSSRVDFSMNVGPGGVDGFNFDHDGGEVCLVLSTPGDARVLLGGNHVPVSRSFNIDTLGACSIAPTPELSVTGETVTESEGSATMIVSLSAASSDIVRVNFATREESAQQGEDFYGAFRQLTFNPGETEKTVTLTIINDNEVESTETFTGRLFAADGAVIASSEALTTIEDDDTGGPAPEFVVEPAEVGEGDGTVTVNVRLTAAASATTSVLFATRNETATGNQDYYGTFTPLEFTAGETLKQVTLTIIEDSEDEADETFTARLFGASGAPIQTSEALVTIVDNDDANQSSFSVGEATVSEGDGAVDVVVTLTPASSDPVSVNFSTRSESAVGGTDFYGTYRLLEFAPGETTKTVTLTVIDDQTPESSEFFTARIWAPLGAPLGQGEAAITIEDDD